MAIKWIGAAWKAQEKTSAYKYERTYIDFRQYIYPPINDDLTYTLIGSGDNQPGSHNLTGGSADYVLAMPSTFTLFIRCLPAFAYDVAGDQPLAGWYVDADNHFLLYYESADDKIKAIWKDGGTERELASAAYVSTVSLQVWHNIAIAFDSTTGSTAGSALYINEASVDAAWSGNIDAKGMEYPLFSLLHEAAVVGDWTVNQVRLYPNKVATAAQVANVFRDLEEEEIVWNLNGEGCGRTRCNVKRHVRSLGIERRVEEPSNGAQGANRLFAELHSHGGEYADDQYAAFDPTAEQFNGTSAQKYLQKQARVEAESWYGTTWEPFFIGRLDNNLFRRHSVVDGLSVVEISADDGVGDIAREMKRRSRSFTGKKLSDATEADSLVHLIARLATSKDVYNYLANSSFENATIANSWVVSGAGATFASAAGGIFGSNEGQLDYAAAACAASQTVTFIGTKKLNKGESYNFSIFCKCANAISNAGSYICLEERAGGVWKSGNTTIIVLAGGEGWKRFEVTHTISDSTSDRLIAYFRLNENVTLSVDGAMLIQGDRAPAWWVLNDNDGAAAVESADDADYDSYDTVGFDVDAVNVTHPYVFIPATTSVWDHLKELADACGPMYFGMDGCGTLKLRCKLATGYADPSSLETVTAVSSVDSVLEMAKANKIIGHGVKVDVYTAIQVMWMLEAVPAFVTGGGKPRVTVTNGSTFPDPTTYGDFWAKYGEVK
jgi:hypothetical protein